MGLSHVHIAPSTGEYVIYSLVSCVYSTSQWCELTTWNIDFQGGPVNTVVTACDAVCWMCPSVHFGIDRREGVVSVMCVQMDAVCSL